MVTKPKANSVITTELTASGNGIIFRVAGAGEVTLDTLAMSAEVRNRAMFHGMIQRISDAAALSRDEETGLSATPADKLAAMRELVEHYASGTVEWSRKRTGGGAREGGILVTALMELYPTATREAIVARVKAWKPVDKLAVMNQANVKAIVDRIRAQATATVNTDDLLAGF